MIIKITVINLIVIFFVQKKYREVEKMFDFGEISLKKLEGVNKDLVKVV